MGRVVRAALVQAAVSSARAEVVDRHVALIEQAADDGAEVVCLQELFADPYFPCEQDPKWFELAEPDDGPTLSLLRGVARRARVVLVVPFFERALEGVYYNTAAVIDADGALLGKYRKNHIPQAGPI